MGGLFKKNYFLEFFELIFSVGVFFKNFFLTIFLEYLLSMRILEVYKQILMETLLPEEYHYTWNIYDIIKNNQIREGIS